MGLCGKADVPKVRMWLSDCGLVHKVKYVNWTYDSVNV